MNGMKIIAVEGLDKAGKHTATNTLSEYFRSKGLKVAQTSFPNYDAPTGKLIGQWLRGEFKADTKVFELLQAADKQLGQAFIQKCEDEGVDILLIDRYTHTNWAYGAYDNDPAWVAELTKHLRQPDVVVYMDVEPEVSMHRRGKFGDNDLYESDIERLRATQHEFERIFTEVRPEIPAKIINANLPPLIVKASVLKTASDLYRAFTGKPARDVEALASITEEERRMLLGWEAAVNG